jgi:hypothetical protein
MNLNDARRLAGLPEKFENKINESVETAQTTTPKTLVEELASQFEDLTRMKEIQEALQKAYDSGKELGITEGSQSTVNLRAAILQLLEVKSVKSGDKVTVKDKSGVVQEVKGESALIKFDDKEDWVKFSDIS